MLGLGKSLKWRILFYILITVVVLVLIKHASNATTGWMKDLKNELSLGSPEDWVDMIKPDYKIENKVKARQRRRKKVRRANNKTSNNKYEEACRNVLEDYFDDYFPTCRPNFLKNPSTGKNLELDGFNARLNLAFEYQGIQHRKYTPKFHKSPEDFHKQQNRDQIKRKILKNLGITLLEIPDTIKYHDLEEYIVDWLKKNRY